MKISLKLPVLALSSLLISQTAIALPVYINEFHYDNVGGDQNEFVELAGQAGTDLNGWSLEFYNGGNGRRYMSWALSGSIADQSNDWGAIAFTGNGGIQNGARDGIALVDANGLVQQFISYEGILTASNSSANGMTSIDIGLSESGSTALGMSLQLTGSGREETDFTWQLAHSTAGLINVGQNIPSLTASVSPQVTTVSEPTNLGLLASAGLLLGIARRRSK